jgi:RimJ/RimL family protein N-acetyltransferase
MLHLGGPLNETASDATVHRWRAEIASLGYGMLAVCLRDSPDPIGAAGLGHPRFESHFTPCVEIGWRLRASAWGNGYATEAATAVLHDGFRRLGLEEIVAFAVAANTRSHRVMAHIGMRHDADGDFTRSMRNGGPAERSVLWRIRARDLSQPLTNETPKAAGNARACR